jgi:hypothetical protein
MGERSVQPKRVGNRGCIGGKEERERALRKTKGDRGVLIALKGQTPRPAPCPIRPGSLNWRRISRQRLYLRKFSLPSLEFDDYIAWPSKRVWRFQTLLISLSVPKPTGIPNFIASVFPKPITPKTGNPTAVFASELREWPVNALTELNRSP